MASVSAQTQFLSGTVKPKATSATQHQRACGVLVRDAGALNAHGAANREHHGVQDALLDQLSNLELVARCFQRPSMQPSAAPSSASGLRRAAQALKQAGSLRRLVQTSEPLAAARELIRRSLEEDMRNSPVFHNPQQLERFLALWLGDRSVECFAALYLNAQHRLICAEVMFRGTVNQTAVYPREIAARALGVHATAVILAHNHPSGLLEASQADRRLTEAINRALQTLDIQLLDHMIVAPNACLSFAQRGWI